MDDLSKFINTVMISYHELNIGKSRFISPTTAKNMVTPLYTDENDDGIGILWATERLPSAFSGKRMTIGHSGEQHGYSSYAFFLKDKPISVVILANGQLDQNDKKKYEELLDLLFTYGEELENH